MTERNTMPDAQPLRPEDPVRLGAYDIIGLLGEGGQGAVYLGRKAGQESDRDHVAIKLLRAGLTADSSARARFVRELEVVKRVARFCTAQVIEADMAGDQPYIISEYVKGPSLHAAVLAEGPRTGGALERLAIGTLTALTAIHQAGIMHRDFKPHNIVLGPDGPRVIDFGIARALDMAAETQIVGTPAYMAPEQFSGHTLGPAADMFAWGSTMVFAATGRPAFGNDDAAAVMHRIMYEEPDLGDLSGLLREAVAACLNKDATRRPTAEQAQRLLMGSAEANATAARAVAVAGDGAAAKPDQLASPTPFGVPADAFTGTPHSVPSPTQAPAAPGPSMSTTPPAQMPMANAPQSPYEAPEATEATPVATPYVANEPWAQPPSHPYETVPSSGKTPSRRPLLLAGGLIITVMLASGTAWVVASAVADSDAKDTSAAASPSAGTPAGTPSGTDRMEPVTSTPVAEPASPGVSPSGNPSGPTGRPRTVGSTQSSRPRQPAAQPTSGGSDGSSSQPNPYTPQQVCNSGGHGSGYYVQRSSTFTGGKVYQLYNSSGYNCVVTLKSTYVGQKTTVWAQITRQDGTKAGDNGSYSYYAGPVFIYAKGQCVKYAGGTAQGSVSAPWGNCG